MHAQQMLVSALIIVAALLGIFSSPFGMVCGGLATYYMFKI